MMRSFIASLILFFSLIGIFAPVSISVTSNISPQNHSESQVVNSFLKISIASNSAFAQIIEGPNSVGTTGASCGWSDFACAITNVIVDIFLFIPNMIALVAGILSDFLLSISINPGTYGVPGSTIETNIQSLWQITRDLANIGFIFALFVAAFGLIVGRDIESFSPKKTVIRVIIMALLVNFSMFFCRIIIQTADILSHVLVNQISVGNLDKTGEAQDYQSNGVVVDAMIKQGIKPVSLKILQQVQPQKLFSKVDVVTLGSGRNAAMLATASVILFVLIALIAIFVHMGFLFLGRIVGLWLGIIMSPLAFVSFAIPFLEKNQYIGFENWLKSFAKLAFLTPLYLFFVYIAISLLDTNFVGTFAENLSEANWVIRLLGLVIGTMLPLSIALFVIFQGKKYATEMAGVIGEMVGKVSGVVSSFAMGAATGGMGFVARQTLGAAGSAIGNSRGLTDAASKGGFSGMLARNAMKMGDKTSAMSFDVRNSKKAMDLFGKATERLGGPKGKIDMGTKFKNEGGFETEGSIGKMPGKYMDGVAKKAEEREKANNEYVQGKLKKQQEEDQRATRENLAISQADVERETNKIKTGAENAIVGADAEQAQLNLAGNNQAIADLKNNPQLKAINEKLKADDDRQLNEGRLKEVDAELYALLGKTDNTSMQKRSELIKEGQDLKDKIKQAPQALNTNHKQKLENDKIRIEGEVQTQIDTLEMENRELLKEVELIALGAAGKTAKEVQVLADKLKLDAADSDSKKDLDKFDVDLSTERAESARLNKLMKVAIDSKNGQEQTRLAGLISTQTNKLNQVAAQQKAAKDNYDREFGKNIKILEDSAKNTMKKFTDSNRTELDRLKKVSTGFQKDLMDIELAGEMRMQASMESLAQSHEGKADRGGITKFVSTATGIVTGGAVGGTNIKNNKAARGSADDARGRSK